MADIPGNEPAPAAAPAQEEDFAAAFAERTGREEEKPEAETPKADEEAPAPAIGEPEDSQGSKEFDPWAGLTEAQKQHFEAIRQSESSNRGRVSALQRKINQMTATAPSSQVEPVERKDSQPDRADKLKQAAEEYPDAVGPLVEAIVDLQARLEASMPKAPEQGAEPDEAALNKEYQALETAHPDYRQIGSDPAYASWVGSKSEQIRALANSYAASDVASVLSLYKAERSASQATPARAETDTTAQKRQRQLEGSRAVQQRGSPAASEPARDDFNAAFNSRASRRP